MKTYYVYKDENGKPRAISGEQMVKLRGIRFVHTRAKSTKGAIKKTRKIL